MSVPADLDVVRALEARAKRLERAARDVQRVTERLLWCAWALEQGATRNQEYVVERVDRGREVALGAYDR